MDKLKVSKETIIRTVALVIVIVYQVAVAAGVKVPYMDESIALTWATQIVTFAVIVWNWWKNNSFTQKALHADLTLHEAQSMGRGDGYVVQENKEDDAE